MANVSRSDKDPVFEPAEWIIIILAYVLFWIA